MKALTKHFDFCLTLLIIVGLSTAETGTLTTKEQSEQYMELVKNSKSAIYCEIMIQKGKQPLNRLSLAFEQTTDSHKWEIDLLLYEKSHKEKLYEDIEIKKSRKLIESSNSNDVREESDINSISILRDVNPKMVKHQRSNNLREKEEDNKTAPVETTADATSEQKNPESGKVENETKAVAQNETQVAKPPVSNNNTSDNGAKSDSDQIKGERPPEDESEPSYSIYGRCRLPIDNDTAIERFSNTCNDHKNKKITISFARKLDVTPTTKSFDLGESPDPQYYYYLQELEFGPHNKISFNSKTCVVEISSANLYIIRSLALMIIYLITA